MTSYTDPLGISPELVPKWMSLPHDPYPPKIKDPEACMQWRMDWEATPCWWCGDETDQSLEKKGEIHHLVRHDCVWAFTWLCATCHRHSGEAVTRAALPHLLFLKWTHDTHNTSWLHLAIAYKSATGRYLPEPEEEKP